MARKAKNTVPQEISEAAPALKFEAPMSEKPEKDSREGHKQRLITAVLQNGEDAFPGDDSKWIELMLTFAIPRRSQREAAHELLEKFKTLPALLDASPEEIQEVKGVGKNATVFFSCIKAFMTRYLHQEMTDLDKMNSSRKFADYARMKLADKAEECFMVFLLDNRYKLLKTEEITKGSTNNVAVYPSTVAKKVMSVPKTTTITICHNHPSGSLSPSADDDVVTQRIQTAMDALGITLLDHIIVAKGGFYSYRFEEGKKPPEKRILKPLK